MSEPALRIRTTRLGAAAELVTVAGDLDSRTAPLLERELAQLDATSDVVVDLEEVRALDAAALLPLVDASRRLGRFGAMMIVVCERPAVRQLLAADRWRDALLVEDSLADAHRFVIGRVLLRRLKDTHTAA